MYLKKIEIQGFKSFANKIVLDFNDGITGIVGPNGSGKSNVADAVRWVLGEQSAKQLRGGNMQDVIFAGTALRKPQGFAYVALTLDNSDHKVSIDFDEVTVSRRLFRSGESEYMLNGSICRLKDINELFYDTGIGKDGYSLIGQGQIDQILSAKPDDRRELFDEAVGITKFRRRKLLTEKKLESERQNLVRISDILAELEKQIGPLKKQSEDAKVYFRLKEEQRKYDVNYFLLESDKLSSSLNEVSEQAGILQTDFDETTKESENLKAQYEFLENSISELDKSASEEKEKIAETNLTNQDLLGKINVLNEQINTEKMNEEHINSRLETISKELEARTATLSEYTAKEEELNTAFEEAKVKLSDSEKILIEADEKIMLLDKRIEDNNAAVISALSERAEVNADSQKLETLLEQLQIRKSELAQKILKLNSDRSQIEEQYTAQNRKLDEIINRISELEIIHKEKEETIKTLQKETDNESDELNQYQINLETQNAKLESLKNIAERYEGYGSSVKKIMESGNKKGVFGVVADLISVPKEYETAIETALGSRIQNIVTDSEDTAKSLIEFLKENKFGRATFLPLSSMKGTKTIESTFSDEKGVIGIAADLVNSDSRYRDMVNSILGKFIVTENVDDAISLQRRNGYDLRIVTKEGELLQPGGSISGGTYKNSSNLLSRKREIEELENLVKSLSSEILKHKDKLANLKSQLDSSLKDFDDLRVEEQEIYLNKNTISISVDTLSDKLKEFEGASDSYDLEVSNIDAQLADIVKEKGIAIDSIKSIDERHNNLETDTISANTELDIAKVERENLANAFSQSQIETIGHRQNLEFVRENIKRVKEEIANFISERDSLNGATDAGRISIEEKLKEIESNRSLIEENDSLIKTFELKVSETLKKKDEFSIEQKQYFDKKDELAVRLSALDKDIFRLQTRKEKYEEQLDNLVSYIWNEYELTKATAEQFKDTELSDISAVKKQADSYKSEIRKLGDINPNAIEQYEEVSQRYELMSTQHSDIVKAEGQLLKVIAELDKGMRVQFEEKFKEIDKEFNKVFKELFGGGIANLKLDREEGEDILEAGIIINAQPPGKKLQNMMQLSGGEKALTAIALIFAIQNLRPSPFALLDEIEAALDESNVDRFAHYLHKLASLTQFIVITHRRGTMVSADRLYGITMQEKGVSTLVSVNLIEDELDK